MHNYIHVDVQYEMNLFEFMCAFVNKQAACILLIYCSLYIFFFENVKKINKK